jgi:hypothetical protein
METSDFLKNELLVRDARRRRILPAIPFTRCDASCITTKRRLLPQLPPPRKRGRQLPVPVVIVTTTINTITTAVSLCASPCAEGNSSLNFESPYAESNASFASPYYASSNTDVESQAATPYFDSPYADSIISDSPMETDLPSNLSWDAITPWCEQSSSKYQRCSSPPPALDFGGDFCRKRVTFGEDVFFETYAMDSSFRKNDLGEEMEAAAREQQRHEIYTSMLCEELLSDFPVLKSYFEPTMTLNELANEHCSSLLASVAFETGHSVNEDIAVCTELERRLVEVNRVSYDGKMGRFIAQVYVDEESDELRNVVVMNSAEFVVEGQNRVTFFNDVLVKLLDETPAEGLASILLNSAVDFLIIDSRC